MFARKALALGTIVILTLLLLLPAGLTVAAGGTGGPAAPTPTPDGQSSSTGGGQINVEVILEEPTSLTPPYGPICTTAWYRYVNNRGHYAYLTLNTNDPAQSTNSGRWTPSLPYSGYYEVFAYIPTHQAFVWPCTGQQIDWDTTDARYRIYYSGGNTVVSRNQKPVFNDWINLGTYYFNAGTGGYVILTDLNGEPNFSYFVSFSAMRFVLQSSSISGRITDSAGYPIAGVTVSDGAGHTATTNSSGDYTIGNLNPGTYTITPSGGGRTFSPSSRVVTVPPNGTGKNFAATNRYAISGRVTDRYGNGIGGVPISCVGLTYTKNVSTAGDGQYVCGDLVAGFYLVRGTNGSPYLLSPKVRVMPFLPPNKPDQNFATTPLYGTLTGRVTDQTSGAGVANARVSVAGRVGYANSNGNYTIGNILPGNHTLRVSANGYHDYATTVTIVVNTTTTRNVALQPIRPEGFLLPWPGGISYYCTVGNSQGYHRQSYYGNEYAFDFGTAWNTVVAARDGRVLLTRVDGSGGLYARIRHSDGSDTLYLHLNQFYVREGDFVTSGTPIGQSGDSGFAFGAHLHFVRYEWDKWLSIPTSFLDVGSNNGVPVTNGRYTSDNYRQAGEGGVTALPQDTEPPQGDVHFRLTGEPTYTLRLWAADYLTDVLSMRLSATQEGLATASWQPYTTTMDWTYPAVFAQYQDGSNNVSAVYSDTIEAIGFEPVQAAFSVSPTVCVGQNLPVTNQTTPFCEQCGWSWDFGNGTTSEEAEPQRVYIPWSFLGYTTPGFYTVTLAAANVDSISTAAHQVQALPSPTAGFTVTRSGATVAVEAHEQEAMNWLWDFGDGATASGRVAQHTYTDTTDIELRVIRLQVVGGNGCSGMSFQYVPDEAVAGLGAFNNGPTVLGNGTILTATITAGTHVSFTWSLGDGNTATGPTAQHFYTVAGTYVAIVTATNSVSQDRVTTTVDVDEVVTGLAATNDGPTALGTPTHFTASVAAGSRVIYSWDWGDGSIGSGPGPTHIYTEPGSYTAIVTAANSVSALTTTTAVVVEEAIAGLAAVNDSPTVLGMPAHFTASIAAGSNVAYVWMLGDGATASGPEVTHSYAAPGAYTVLVTASNAVSAATTTTTVVVEEAVAGLAVASNGPTVLGDVTHLTATIAAGSNVAYLWDLGDGASASGPAVAYIYAAPGTYSVVVTAGNAVSTATATSTVVVEESIAGLEARSDSPTVLGTPAHFTASVAAGSNVSYAWDWGDGATGTGATAAHTYTTEGSYTVVVTATNSVSKIAVTTTAIVEEAVAGLTATSDSPTVLGDATHLTATIAAGSHVDYAWSLGDGTTVQGSAVAHDYAVPGAYTVVVTASNAVGAATATTTVVVEEAIADLAVISDSPVILGSATHLTATVAAGSNVNYIWDLGDGTAGSGPVIAHTYVGVGSYAVIVTATNSVGALTARAAVVVEEAIAGLTAASDSPTLLGHATHFTATVTAGSNVTYAWDFGDGAAGSGFAATHTYAAAGTYTVTLIAKNIVSEDMAAIRVAIVEPQFYVYLPLVVR